MSVTLMAAVWPLDMPTTDKMVLLALADAANDSGVTWIAVRSRKQGEKLDILRKCSLSERAVQGAIKRLAAAGHLKRDETPGKGCTYTVQPQTPAADAPRTKCAPQQTTGTPAADAGKPSITIKQPKGSAGATCVPEDFWPLAKPESITGKAMAAWPPGEIEEQVEHFIDRHTAMGTKSLCWQASWRTWVKNWKKFNGKRPANDHRPHRRSDEIDDAAGRLGFA